MFETACLTIRGIYFSILKDMIHPQNQEHRTLQLHCHHRKTKSWPQLTYKTINVLFGHVVFTVRCYASAVLAMGPCPSVCVCLCPSVTSRCSTKTAKRRITQTTPHDTPGTLVFWCQRSPRNSTGVTLYEGAECRWGGSKSATFDIYPAISRKR